MTTALALKPLRLWPRHPREAGAASFAALVAVFALGGVVDAMPSLGELADHPKAIAHAPVAPPSAAATDLRDVAPQDAAAINASIPVAAGVAGAARPFSLGSASVETRAQALDCLTSAVYYEAGQESDAGQRAVAQVVLNRVRHPAFPNSVCGVVYQGSTRQTGCQFTFTCDGSLARGAMPDAWDRARRNAKAMLDGAVYAPVGNATHYHADYVVPYWASSLVKTQVVGAHLFYRWAGAWGQPSAFAQAYGGHEPNARALRAAALAVPHLVPKMLIASASDLGKVDGVKLSEAANGRVTAHFSPAARAATDKIKVVPYVERVQASDNLRYALGAEASSEPAFGKAAPTTSETRPAS